MDGALEKGDAMTTLGGWVSLARRAPLALGLAACVLGGSGAVAAADLKDVPMLREGSAAPTPWKRYGNWTKAEWPFNTLADHTKTPPAPKKGEFQKIDLSKPGDPEKGMKLAFSRDRGSSCVTCHVMGPKTPELPGNVGIDLSEIGAAGRDDEYLFNYVYDARSINPESLMLPWGRNKMFSAEEIRDIVAFLQTLKTPATFKTALDDPNARPLPVEDRDWRDPFVNPAAEAIETGAALYAKAGPNGKSCASCHDKPEVKFKRWSVTMPKWDSASKRMIGVEEFVYRHGAATMDAKYLMQGSENLQFAVYLRALSNGEKIDVDIKSPGAKESYERGEKLTKVRVGQLNLACVDCHTPEMGANHWLRGQYLGELKGQIPHFPTWRTSRNEVWDIRKRLEWCNVQIRANDLPPDAPEYADLELYLTAASNGLVMEAPGIRH